MSPPSEGWRCRQVLSLTSKGSLAYFLDTGRVTKAIQDNFDEARDNISNLRWSSSIARIDDLEEDKNL